MTRVVLTDEAYQAIKSHRIPGSNWRGDEDVQLPDGNWDVELSDESIARMDGSKLPGESYSEVMLRLIQENEAWGRPADGTHRVRR